MATTRPAVGGKLDLPGARTDLTCPEPSCPGRLVLKSGKYGPFYGCSKWASSRCPGGHGAHEDGSPLGIPAPQKTRRARRLTHELFDKMWREPDGYVTRGGAYRWLQLAMNMTADDAHIGRFTLEECRKLYRILLDTSPSEVVEQLDRARR